MKILVTGSDGQLGRSIQQRSSLYPDFKFDYTDIDQLDITDKSALKLYIEVSKPDVIIHCAAYTAVDKAEEEREKAFLLNATAVEYLAQLALENKILLIHISTDFVFDGKSNKPYIEEDIAQPLSIYGKSKLAGENAIINCVPNAIIIRTSWLYSEYGHNFVKTILRLATERSEIKVVSDQIGTPTYAGDLADA
ncbi:MAG: dTDP-4-dehydrorhamnose reductase, partial [Bacteroidales bacterium]|nr:dTDP-4-dehydrorhamnose reductase [Bacteroidales bacterium]